MMANAGTDSKRPGPSALATSAVVLLWLVAPVFIGFAAYPAACGLGFMRHYPSEIAVCIGVLAALLVSLTPWICRGRRSAMLAVTIGAVWLGVSVPFMVATAFRAKCGTSSLLWGLALRAVYSNKASTPPYSDEVTKDVVRSFFRMPNACECATEEEFVSDLGTTGWKRVGAAVFCTDPRGFTGELRDVMVGYTVTPSSRVCEGLFFVILGDGMLMRVDGPDDAEIVRRALRAAEESGFPSPPREFGDVLERVERR